MLLARPNRFLVIVELEQDGRQIEAHCTDSGRLEDILVAGCRVLVVPQPGWQRGS